MKYIGLDMPKTFEIKTLMSFHSSKYMQDYRYKGEYHNFWELVYVKSGSLGITADAEVFEITDNTIVFHQPNEFHTLWSSGGTSPEVVIISFVCDDPIMDFFRRKVMLLNACERNILYALDGVLNNVVRKNRVVNDNSKIVLQDNITEFDLHMVKNYLELLLLDIYTNGRPAMHTPCRHDSHEEIYSSIVEYMRHNVCERISTEELCRVFGVSRTTLKMIFSKYTQNGVMKHFLLMKIHQSKSLLAQGFSVREAAEKLSFSSQNYFCSAFKRETGITPLEYKKRCSDLHKPTKNNIQ